MTVVALVGNSNVGKTTFFNCVTDSDEHTGNWAGVTVDVNVKHSAACLNCDFCDLPGIYSLNCFSMEEQTAKDFLESNKSEMVFNIADCNNLSRNLFLTLQLIEMGVDVKLFVNMIGEVEKRGGTVNLKQLEEILSIPVFGVDARNKSDCICTVQKALESKKGKIDLPYLNKLPLSEILDVVYSNLPPSAGISAVYIALRLFLKDGKIFEFLKLSAGQISRIESITKGYGDTVSYLAKLRYDFIDSFIKRVISVPDVKLKIEKLLFGRFFSVLIFFAVLAAVFWVTFSKNGLGTFLAGQIDRGLSNLKSLFFNGMQKAEFPAWLISFINDALVDGVGAVAKFVPQIVLLFLFLNALEDTGYISRVAFTFDGFMSKVGLNGKSILTLLLGFGCNTSAVLVSKNLSNKDVQRRTLLLLPFIPCSAKMPVFLIIMALAAPLFAGWEFFVVFLLYIFAIFVVWMLSGVLFSFDKKQLKEEFVFELPPLRLPSAKRVLQSVWKSVKSFLVRVAGILFICIVVAWLLKSFSFSFTYLTAEQIENSILAWLGKTFSFLFRPLGVSDWRICVALILGVAAKEVVAGTLVILFSGGFGAAFDIHSVIIMLLFVLLYIPCIATIAAIKNECGRKTALLSVMLNCGAAYFVCFVYSAAVKLFKVSAAAGIAVVAGVAVIYIILRILLLRKKRNCSGCGKCFAVKE